MMKQRQLLSGGVLACLILTLLITLRPSGAEHPVEVIEPFRIQKTDCDCGPAALKIVLSHFGVNRSLEEIAQLAKATAQGTSMLDLKKCAETYGLAAAGWALAPQDLSSIPLPAIVFLKSCHFAVLEGVHSDSRQIVLTDPSQGRIRLSADTFFNIWSDKVLIIHSGERRTT